MLSRSTWGAKHRDGFGSRKQPAKTAHIHHSVTRSPGPNATLAEDIAAVRTLENIGQARFGGGISYSRVVMESGRVFEGLPANRIGAHTKGHNTTGMGYVLVGDWSKHTPPVKQVDALVAAIRTDIATGNLAKGAQILGHRDTSSTACPGLALYETLPKIRLDVAGAKPAPKPKPTPKMPVLRRGSRGGAVVTLQQALNRQGAKPKVPADGVFGAKTRDAVVAFQRKHKLTADGIVGPKTWGELL